MPHTSAFDPPPSFTEAAELLRRRGIKLRQHPGYYSVNFRNGGAATEYQTEDFTEAVTHGMAMKMAPSPPPLGPIGKSMTQRAQMYRHNRKLAAKRLRAALKLAIPTPSRPRRKSNTVMLDLTGEIAAASRTWRCPQCSVVYDPPYTVYISPLDGLERCPACART